MAKFKGEPGGATEPDLEVLLLLPLALPVYAAVRLRGALVRRLGRVRGNLIGVPVVALVGAFPLVYGCLLVLVLRLLWRLLGLLDRLGNRSQNPSL
jgi:hypothetical protein